MSFNFVALWIILPANCKFWRKKNACVYAYAYVYPKIALALEKIRVILLIFINDLFTRIE